MFEHDSGFRREDLDPARLRRLYRSTNAIQVALPDYSGQAAQAYVGQMETEQGVEVSVLLELREARRLVCFREISASASRATSEARALAFVESMGFLMTDLQWSRLSESERRRLWQMLPLGHEGRPESSGLFPGNSEASRPPRRPLEALGEGMEQRRLRLLANVSRLLAMR